VPKKDQSRRFEVSVFAMVLKRLHSSVFAGATVEAVLIIGLVGKEIEGSTNTPLAPDNMIGRQWGINGSK
jgi:hypothetical protein